MSFRLGEEVIISMRRKIKGKKKKIQVRKRFLFVEKGRRECFEREVGEVE